MIKINLANTLVNKTDTAKTVGTGMAGQSPKDIAVKVLLILLPLVGIYIYESTSLDAKIKELSSVQTTQMNLTNELTKLGPKDDIVQQHKAQQKEMTDRKDVMTQIFGLRSKKIATLDLLQRYIPASCWLKKIKLETNTVSILGYANDIQGAHDYISSLSEQKDIFSAVAGQDISEEKDSQGNMSGLYKFEFVLEIKEK